jgi:hypothetical protein
MVEEPSHVKKLTLNHVYKIWLRNVGDGGSGEERNCPGKVTQKLPLQATTQHLMYC